MYGLSEKNNKFVLYPFKDKKRAINNYVMSFYNRSNRMFEWKNLPDTITHRSIEFGLQYNGYMAIAHNPKDGQLYCLFGGLGGELDHNYMPTKFIFSNPWLKWNDTLTVNQECVIIPNDTMYRGMYDLYTKYATMLCENDISMFMQLINSRTQKVFTATDDLTKDSVKAFMRNLEAGELSAITSKVFQVSGDKSFNAFEFDGGMKSRILDGIEFNQYMVSKLFNEIGLQANYNMKREAINGEEAGMNTDSLHPLVDDMFECRRKAVERVNELFGTSWSVDYGGVWKQSKIELENIIKKESMINSSYDTDEQMILSEEMKVESEEKKND